MRSQESEDLRAYRDKLQAYTTEELEDIYFRVHVLRHPLRYNLVRRELESRSLRPQPPREMAIRRDGLRSWLAARPALTCRPLLFALVFAMLLFTITAAAAFLLLLPIWLFAMPLHFLGFETALVYLVCAPVPPILAAGLGGKLGGRGIYGVFVLMGVVAGLLLFNATGAPSAIIQSAFRHATGGGGPSFGGF